MVWFSCKISAHYFIINQFCWLFFKISAFHKNFKIVRSQSYVKISQVHTDRSVLISLIVNPSIQIIPPVAAWLWLLFKKNNNKLWNIEHCFCSKITSNKIVHYSAIFTVNLSKIRCRHFELHVFMIKSVQFFKHLVYTAIISFHSNNLIDLQNLKIKISKF